MKSSFRLSGCVLAALLALGGAAAQAADKVTVQLKWVPQAQFAGYYVAQAKGFYKEAGLDVTIKPGGPDISPVQVIAGKSADAIVNWMPDALAAREAGVPLVNIAQVFDRSGLMLTCKKASGVSSPKDLKGKTLGVWYGGNEYPFLNWMAKLGHQDPEAGLQRRPAAAEPGGLHLDHDLQRVLAGGGCRRQGKRSGDLLL